MSEKEIIKAFERAYREALKIEIALHNLQLKERGIYVL